MGRILGSLFLKKTRRLRHREWRPTRPRSSRRGGGLSPGGPEEATPPASGLHPTKQRPGAQWSRPRASPSPTPVPKALPALPLILQPAVIVWARIHLQHQLHGEPCPAGGLRGPRAVLSCPEGWGRGPGLRAGLGPPASAAWACLSASSPLQKPGELIKNRWAGRGGSGWLPTPALPRQPSAAGSFLPRPFAAAAVAAASPAGSGYCNQCRAPPALPMPRSCRGLAWPPLPGPGLDADGRNLGCFPPKASPGSAFKGPAAQVGLLVVRWGWGWGGTVIPKFSTKGCSAPAAHQAGFLDSAAWGGSRRLLLPTWVQTEPGPLPQGSVLPSRKCLEAKEAPRRG